MRKWFVVAVIAGFLGSANDSTAQSWSLPIRAGWSNARVTGDNQLGSESVNGFVGSFGAALRVNQDVSVEFDIAYAQKGSKGIITNEVANSPTNPPQQNIFTIDGETSLDYVEFWTMFIAHLPIADKSEVKGYLGLSLANLVNAEVKGTANGQPFEDDLRDGIRDIDWAGLIGAGITYDLKSVTLTLDFIAELGFININDSALDELNFKTRAFYTMLGVAIPLPTGEN